MSQPAIQAYRNISRGDVAAAAVVLPLIDVILTGLRFYSKKKRNTTCRVEDWLVIPAVTFMIGMGIASVVGVADQSEGTFASNGTVDPKFITSLQIFWATEWMQCLALGCAKLSFIFFYRTVFNVKDGRRNIFDIATMASLVIVVIWAVGFFLAIMFTCGGDITAYWNTAIRAQKCYNTRPFLYAYTWSDVGTDLIIFILPIPILLRLHMTLRKKIAIVGIFILGGLALAASITRAILYLGLLGVENNATGQLLFADLNAAMENTNGIYWMLIETGIGLMAVNLPIVYSLMRREGVQTVIEQVRSIISLASLGSRGSKGSRGSRKNQTAPAKNPDLEASDVELAQRGESSSSHQHDDIHAAEHDIEVPEPVTAHAR